MCGIAGIIETRIAEGGSRNEELDKHLLAMQRALYHRGPDDKGLFVSRGGTAGLISTRLAILDLSPAGHQPMTSPDRRYTVVFNGEIYNYCALRDQITNGALRAELSVNGYQLRSHCDTEIVLELYRREGPACVKQLDGMFAFAIWDELEQSCFLARDPLGIKPLYYSLTEGRLCFASEIRALIVSGLVTNKLSATGVRGYLKSGSVPEPNTLLEDVQMLPAGHYLAWKDGKATVTKYWEIDFGEQGAGSAEHGAGSAKQGAGSAKQGAGSAKQRAGSAEQRGGSAESEGRALSRPSSNNLDPITNNYTAIVRAALEESIERHLVSDVPVGVFLSGGIDSTILVALAARRTGKPLRTFSISFDDLAYDEGIVAARTAAQFRTKHSDWRLDAVTAKGLLKEFLARSDQPSIDGFNTFCVSKMAHDHGLKVVLSGLGGDELFGGYQSFAKVPAMLKVSQRMEFAAHLRRMAGRVMERFGSPRVRRLGSFLQGEPGMEAAYNCMRGVFTAREADRLLPLFGIYSADGGSPSLNHQLSTLNSHQKQPTWKDEVSYLELTRYMRNQLLRDSDVMSMAWSLELRVPFVDRKLIDAVSQIPAHWRLAPGKQILLDAVPEIPEWVRNRPKQGFTFPFQQWVMSEWRDVFERLEQESPVSLRNWYRKWCLFALEEAVGKMRQESRELEARRAENCHAENRKRESRKADSGN